MSASESRSAVVLELAEEFLERYRQGQRPSLKEYIERHPELAAEIKEVFPAMALMENVALADESLAGAATGPATPAEATPPQQLGDYRILREVGRGGMGIVYEAEQVSLGRHVALKVLPRQMFVDDSQRRRFEREAKAAAKLHHTNIVPVFGVGDHDSMPYYVMQFIQGLGLDEVLEELKRMQGSGPATATGGELRVSRKDVSAADVARSLLTGEFQVGEPAALAAGLLHPAANAAGSPESSVSGKLSDSFTLSSSVKLPGSDGDLHGRTKKTTYWQSVAQIGLQVAQALEYAHKQGIQHRDIKPSNLLLDTHGTVWVTDFGLARADNEDHLTQTGDIVGTLRYLPPEAFEGRADKRGDIYSLGLTLYELLALKPAYEERDRHRLIKRVTTEEPAHLDKFNRSIPRDLATIVHKAIDREPGRRYQTAEELAADLQCFLDDEPIQARRISTVERLGRWCRRHPGVATLTGILVLLLIGVMAASLLAAVHFDRLALREAQSAEKERLARQQAEQAEEHEAGLRRQAEEAKQQAEQAKQQAERQKRRAESNFAKARKAVDDYFTTVSESQLLQVPGMQPLRRDLLQSTLTFYEDFLKERGDDPALRGELAAAYLRVGKIRSEAGVGAEARQAFRQALEHQTARAASCMECHAQAKQAYERALATYEELAKTAPEAVEWRHGRAQCYYRLGLNEEAIALWEKLVQPGQPRFQKELAEAYNTRANKLENDGKLGEALQAHQQALAIREMLIRLNPEDADAHRDLGATLHNFGGLLYKEKRLAEALAMYRRAAEHEEAAFARAPQVLVNGGALAISHSNIADLERQLGHANQALAAYQRVVEVWRKLARDNPAVSYLHGDLFIAYHNLAIFQRELKQTEHYKQTMHLAREVIKSLPSVNAFDLYNRACCHALLAAPSPQGKEKATAEEKAEQTREADLAIEALRQAIAAGFPRLDVLRKEKDLDVLRGRDDFKALQADLAVRRAAAPADKLKAHQQALAPRQKMLQTDPKNKRLQADLAASQHAIALLQLDLDKLDDARRHFDQAVILREALVKDEPKNTQYQADLEASRLHLYLVQACQFAEQKRTNEAEAALTKIAAFPSNDAKAYRQRGRTYFALGQTDKATADFRKAVASSDDKALEALALPSEPAVSEADKLLVRLAGNAFLQRLTAAVERSPEDMARRWKRGEWYAHHARWKEAAADWRTALEQKPPEDALAWLYVSPALAAGDREGYHWLCREVLKRFGDTKDPTTAERIAKPCLLFPELAKELERAYALADLTVAQGKDHGFRHYFIFCKALADYRRGIVRAAIEGIDPVLPKTGDGGAPSLTTEYLLVLAMALHREGEEKAAREHLTRAAKLLDKFLLDPIRAPILKNSRYHHDWLMAWFLYHEAKVLIEGNKAEPKK